MARRYPLVLSTSEATIDKSALLKALGLDGSTPSFARSRFSPANLAALAKKAEEKLNFLDLAESNRPGAEMHAVTKSIPGEKTNRVLLKRMKDGWALVDHYDVGLPLQPAQSVLALTEQQRERAFLDLGVSKIPQGQKLEGPGTDVDDIEAVQKQIGRQTKWRFQASDVRNTARRVEALLDDIGLPKCERVGMQVRRISEGPWAKAYKDAVTGTEFTIRRDARRWVLIEVSDVSRWARNPDTTTRYHSQEGLEAIQNALLMGIATVGEEINLIPSPKLPKPTRISEGDAEALTDLRL